MRSHLRTAQKLAALRSKAMCDSKADKRTAPKIHKQNSNQNTLLLNKGRRIQDLSEAYIYTDATGDYQIGYRDSLRNGKQNLLNDSKRRG